MKQEHLATAASERPTLVAWSLQHLDAVAALVVVLLIVLHFAGILFPLPEGSEEATSKIRASRQGIESTLKSTRYDSDRTIQEMAALTTRLRDSWGRRQGDLPQVADGLTYSQVLIDALRRGESNEIRFESPVDVKAEAEAGVIHVTWAKNENNNVPVSAFAVLRSEPGIDLQEVARTAKDECRYDDRAIRAGVKYSYFIVALTADPMVRAQKEKTAPSLPGSAEAAADFKLTLLEADVDKKSAVLLVEKWQDEHWFQKRFTVKSGETIGTKDEGSGVDYGTGRTIASMVAEPATETRTRREVVFDSEGRVKLQGDIPVTEEVTATETYTKVTVTIEGGNLPPATLNLDLRSAPSSGSGNGK